jgi:hypothetical protein
VGSLKLIGESPQGKPRLGNFGKIAIWSGQGGNAKVAIVDLTIGQCALCNLAKPWHILFQSVI